MGAPGSIDQYPAVIFFDGVCNLCNGMVRFVIRRDPRKHLYFATLQSELGYRIAQRAGVKTGEGIILYVRGEIFTRSSAVLQITRRLSGLWPGLFALIIIPRKIRDWVYNLVARNRYRWFGTTEECPLPTPDLTSRFLN